MSDSHTLKPSARPNIIIPIKGAATNTPVPLSKLIFEKADKDKSGALNYQEFHDMCYEMGYYLSETELKTAIKLIDSDSNGTVEYKEFLEWWRTENRFGKMKLTDEQLQLLNLASNYFRHFDTDKSGSLDKKEFIGLHKDLVRLKYTNKPVDKVMEEIDLSRDGKIQFNEYIDWLVRIGSLPFL
ncbi:calcium-dependent protein kinase 21 [Planoprotostelium fungivorum]|uniref:Calcium-dependent protein kinase 21 n=1 Tax=Planoprotostelium fungivorum TaxID=1890364 RepID=A0A2P6MN48_9EUKA|nr:calcium-dependent protein kinase 21 [Planoprotostelium fungivorum]